MCIVSFCIGNNYRDLTAASLCVRLLQTHLLHRSPPGSLEQRSMQPVWWWRLLHFSHRETCSHHKGSFAGHTQIVLRQWGWTQSVRHLLYYYEQLSQLNFYYLASVHILYFSFSIGLSSPGATFIKYPTAAKPSRYLQAYWRQYSYWTEKATNHTNSNY